MTSAHLNSRGFSLVELMTVIVVVGILASIVVPSLDDSFGTASVRQGAAEVANVFRKAREKAMSRGEVVLLQGGHNPKPTGTIQLYRSDTSTSLCSQASMASSSFYTYDVQDSASSLSFHEEEPNNSGSYELCFAPDGRVFQWDGTTLSTCDTENIPAYRITVGPGNWTRGDNPVGSPNPNDCREEMTSDSEREQHRQGREAVNLWEARVTHFGGVKVVQ